jgi:hypothetical protein
MTMNDQSHQAQPLPVTVIRPSKGWVALHLRDLWEYRELVYFLAWRDISVRYKQTALGAAWAIIQPFFTMVVFSLFFGRLAREDIRQFLVAVEEAGYDTVGIEADGDLADVIALTCLEARIRVSEASEAALLWCLEYKTGA